MPALRQRSVVYVSALSLGFAAPVLAQSNDGTEIGLYGFGTAISGEQRLGPIESDIEASFGDIWDNLDIPFMAWINHRAGKWSIVADIFYADLSADGSSDGIDSDVGLQQTIFGLYGGYSLFSDSFASVDALFGLRYNSFDVSLNVEGTSQQDLPVDVSREGDRNWTDAVIGVRGTYSFGNGWGVNGWLDAGAGDDSKSYQALVSGNYQFENNVKLYAGYRLYHFEYEDGSGDNRFEIDADYSGPIFGISYRF